MEEGSTGSQGSLKMESKTSFLRRQSFPGLLSRSTSLPADQVTVQIDKSKKRKCVSLDLGDGGKTLFQKGLTKQQSHHESDSLQTDEPAEETHPEGVYSVVFTVNIAMAVPNDLRDPSSVKKLFWKYHTRSRKKLLAQNYYHLEYSLVPDNTEMFRTDVVTYGVAAKVYLTRHRGQVIKTWKDGELTWIAWSHQQTLTVTQEMLIKMVDHTLELRFWNSKQKCSTRARCDKPVAFRLSKEEAERDVDDARGVKALVMKQFETFIKTHCRKLGPVRPLPHHLTFPRFSRRRGSRKVKTAECFSLPPSDESSVASDSSAKKQGSRKFYRWPRVQTPAGFTRRTLTDDEKRRSSTRNMWFGCCLSGELKDDPVIKLIVQDHSQVIVTDMILPEIVDPAVKQANRRKDAEALAVKERVLQYGICMISIKMSHFFHARVQSAAARLEEPHPELEDLIITVSVDKPLLSEHHQKILNPMTINIKSVTNMPDFPMSFKELRDKCEPVYCKYQFLMQPTYKTCAKEQARNIYWEDKHVILLGREDHSEVLEYLAGPPMAVEVHDQDRKIQEPPKLFGYDPADVNVCSAGYVTGRSILDGTLQGCSKPWDPYGVCQVNLSELLLGLQFLDLRVPIHSCALPDDLDHGARWVSRAASRQERPKSSSGYIQSSAYLKIQVDLTCPLISPADLAAKKELKATAQCPYGRIIYIFAYKNAALLQELRCLVGKINGAALGLDDMPRHLMFAATCTYKLSIEQQRNKTLNILTGFHVLDGLRHIIVLEGLKSQGIKCLWEKLPKPETPDVQILYNSDFNFSHRLYGPLDVNLFRVKLQEPVQRMVHHSLMYVRDMIPKPCFRAVTRLEEVTRVHTMREVVKNNVLPTSHMMMALEKEFGVCFTTEDLEERSRKLSREIFGVEEA